MNGKNGGRGGGDAELAKLFREETPGLRHVRQLYAGASNDCLQWVKERRPKASVVFCGGLINRAVSGVSAEP